MKRQNTLKLIEKMRLNKDEEIDNVEIHRESLLQDHNPAQIFDRDGRL